MEKYENIFYIVCRLNYANEDFIFTCIKMAMTLLVPVPGPVLALTASYRYSLKSDTGIPGGESCGKKRYQVPTVVHTTGNFIIYGKHLVGYRWRTQMYLQVINGTWYQVPVPGYPRSLLAPS